MENIYRLIGKICSCHGVSVSESAKHCDNSIAAVRNHLSQKGVFRFLNKPAGNRPLQAALCGLLTFQLLLPPAMAQSIIADGRTNTQVSPGVSDGVSNVTTSTTRGDNAFNSFSRFSVESGETVNLFLPTGTENLINLVRGPQTTIEGLLNSIKNDEIGGNVYFANPNGFLISSSGVFNVGSLSLSTPTPAFIDNFFISSGNPNEDSVADLLSGTAPRNDTGDISILGQVHAIDQIKLSAGAINVGGTLYSGAHFLGSAPDFSDVVNDNDLIVATNVIEREGRIEIVADSSVDVSGLIAAPGSTTVNAGNINISAGGNPELSSGGEAAIRVDNATLTGRDVTLSASTTYDNSDQTLLLPVEVPTAVSTVDIHSSTINAIGDLSLEAVSLIDVSSGGISPLGSNVAVSTAIVDVRGDSVLSSGGNTGLNAVSTVRANASPGTSDIVSLPGDAGVALNVIASTAEARIGGDSLVTSTGALDLTAGNTVTAITSADASAEGAVAIGGTVALSEVITVTKSSIEDTAQTQSGSLKVEADSVNTVTTLAQAASQGATKQTEEEKTANPSKTEETLTKYQDEASTADGSVDVAAAVAVANVNSTTQASIHSTGVQNVTGTAVVSSNARSVSTVNADGSSVNEAVGVGAAVGLNIGVLENRASIGDNSRLNSNGLTVSATMPTDSRNVFDTTARSGAGAGNVGVAGSLALNTVVNTTVASLEGDRDGSGAGATVDAGTGDVLVRAENATTNTVKSGADVKMTGDSAAVGVGASIGLNVVVNTTAAEIEDEAVVTGGNNLGLNAKGNHVTETEVTGGAAGAKVSITPVVAAAISVNTTTARLGTSDTALNLTGEYESSAEQTNKLTTKATGQAQGDVAVGASLGATIAVDNVSSTVERNIDLSEGIDLSSRSDTSITTEVKAGAKGAKSAKKDENGNETPEEGTTVDEQKKNQLDFAKSRNSGTADVDTDTPEAKTPDTSSEAPGSGKTDTPPDKDQKGKKVSVAAAIGASVAYNQAKAEIGAGRTVNAGAGDLKITADTDTNYRTLATGEAVSDDVGVAAAVALTATYNKTQATLGAGSTVSQADAVDISATAKQNRGEDFRRTMSAEAVSGASGGEVAVGGALALVGNYNETRASIDEGVTIGTETASVGDVNVKSDETSKISAQARAGALSTGGESKAGVGASFAVLLSHNQNTAAVGYDANGNGEFVPTDIFANSLAVDATKNRVWFETPTLDDAKNFVVNDVKNLDFDALDPSTYLGSNNYYTEAIAGAASKGDAAVAGAFAVNVFGNTTEAYLGNDVHVTADSSQDSDGEARSVDIASSSDTQAISFSGAVAGAKKAGVGISNSNVVNLDQTLASIGNGSVVKSTAADADIKVSADSRQDIANVSVSAGIGTENTGVGGVLGAIVSLSKTEAKIGENAEVKSMGDVTVQAASDVTGVLVSGGVGGGKEVGVGASIAANVLANRTSAEIGKNAEVTANRNLAVRADADETAVTAVVAGAGAGNVGVAGAVSLNVILSDTEALVNQGAQLNTDTLYQGPDQTVSIEAHDDTVLVGISGGGAGGGKVGVGAALDTTVLGKSVQAGIADDTEDDGVEANVHASKDILIDAGATENVVSTTMGFGGGGNTGVGGAVSVGVIKNDVQAFIGNSAGVDADGNVLINAQDDITAVITAGAGAGGGTAGVGGSLAVATLLGSTKAYVGDDASVNARGNRDEATVYAGETVIDVQSDTPATPGDLLAKKTEAAKGLSVTAYNRENLVTTVVGGAGGGTAGVAATVSANVIAQNTEAFIGRGAKINESNGNAGSEQQVRVKAVDETLLINTAGAGAGGGSAGVGASANVGVIAKTTNAWIGQSALVNARDAVELDAASSELTFSTTAGFAGGGSAGVGGAVAGVGVANTTAAYIEDGTSELNAAKVNVSDGNLSLNANDLATSWQVTGAGAGGGAAGVGGSLAVGVNAGTTKAKIGDYAETNAAGDTEVHADSTENINTITVAGAGGGSAGVSGAIGVDVVVSKTEAGIGDHARVNQAIAGQNVDVEATDRIITVAAGGAGAGGGAAGVGGTANVTVALNTTSAYIGNDATVDAVQDVTVAASSEKYVNSATVAGAGGGAAGVAGAVSVISVGSLLDGQAKSGLVTQDENGEDTTTQSQADSQTTKSAVGNMLGNSQESNETKSVLDSNAGKLGVSQYMADDTGIPLQNTQAFIGVGTEVHAGEDVTVNAIDKTLAILASGSGAGGGAAGVAGTLGVVLLHDSAEAFIADGAKVDADKAVTVDAETGETVVNIGITGCGGGAAGVCGSGAVNVVSSDTAAYIGAAEINQGPTTSVERSVDVNAVSNSNLITVAGSGGGAGAAAVGGVLNVNTLFKDTKAYIGEGATVTADTNVLVAADSSQNIIDGALSIQGAGAAAVGGAASVNVIGNSTEAFIGSSRDDDSKTAATVDSDGNVAISASDDTLLIGASASGTGAGAAAVGGTVSANVVSSQTRAYVADQSIINARGNAEGTDVYNGTIGDSVELDLLPEGQTGDIDLDGDGVVDGNVSGGASFDINAEGEDGGSAGKTVNPSTVVDSDGTAIAGAVGGLGAKGTDTVKGLSVTAVGNEKLITASIGIAGAGAAGVTGSATADVIASVTEAGIGDGAQINQSGAAGADPSVNVLASDNSFIVMTAGTVAGAGAAAVSGSNNTAVVNKQTRARIGNADVNAKDVGIRAAAEEAIYLITANASVAGAAGVGGAVGVGVIENTTTASIGAGADIDAVGNLAVQADQDSDLDIYTVSGAGGVVGVSGAVSVGVIDNTTRAEVEGSDNPVTASTLNAGGTTEIAANSLEEITSATVSAAGGGVGVAGAVGVKVVSSETTASIGDNTRINQTRTGGQQDVNINATDTVRLRGGGGAATLGAYAAGATSETNIVRNATNAFLGDSTLVNAGRDVQITAESTKDVQAITLAASGGAALGISGAVSVVTIGASLDEESQDSLKGTSDDGSSGDTASYADEKIRQDKVSGELGESEHVQGVQSTLTEKTGSLGVKAEMNETSQSSLDKTRAYVGSGSRIDTERDIVIRAGDKTDVDIVSTGAAGGTVGIGGALGIGITRSTTEAFAGPGAILDADGDVSVQADSTNLNDSGSSVLSTAGAGGVVGLSAAVAVLKDASTTRAYLDDNVQVQDGAIVDDVHSVNAENEQDVDTVKVEARSDRKSSTETWGVSAGGLAAGASVATTTFKGTTDAHLGDSVGVRSDGLTIHAEDNSSASAFTRAGAAGAIAGSGAVSTAEIGSIVNASTGSHTNIDVTGDAGVNQADVDVTAESTANAEAEAIGVSIGIGSVGASVATATSGANVTAEIGESSSITADLLDVIASRRIGSAPTTVANAVGAAGGLLLGANATVAKAETTGSTNTLVGDNSTLDISGTATVQADNRSLQAASAIGASAGLVSAGADFSYANSDTLTQVVIGNGVKVSGDTLQVIATGDDSNYAYSVAGSGGLVSVPFSAAYTDNQSETYARTGSGDSARNIDVDTFYFSATHQANFDSWINNTNASLIGVSGANTSNTVDSKSEAYFGANGYVQAGNITIQAGNEVHKSAPGATIPGLGRNTPSWNVISNSGGLADVPAADSSTIINNNALLQIGESAHLEQTGSRTAAGSFNLEARNNVTAIDKVKMSSGGAVSAASASSTISADTNNAAILVNPLAELSSIGDMALSTRSGANIYSQAAVDVYGAVGVAPAGDTYSRFNADNSIDIGEGATLESLHDININAGANPSTFSNDIRVTARTDVYNNTAIPVNRDPVADAIVDTQSRVTVGSSADIAAVRNVTLAANESAAVVSGVGIGKDIYREALAAVASAFSRAFGGGDVSFETRTGNSIKDQTSDVQVDGDVRVGIERKQNLEIGIDGTVIGKTDGISIIDTGFKDIAADIQSRINDLQQLIEEYTVEDQSSDAAIAVEAYKSEINFLKKKLIDLGISSGEVATSPVSPLEAANDAINGMSAKVEGYTADWTTLDEANTNLNGQIDGYQATITLNDTTIADNLDLIAGLDPNDVDDAAQITALEDQNTGLSNENSTLTNITIPGLENQIGANLVEMGALTVNIEGLNTQISGILENIANNEYSDQATGPVAQFLTVSDATAQLGNIYIRGDRLHGSGTLDAPGDAEIKITNNSPSFMVLKNLTIPPDDGGKVYFNSVDVKNNDDINNVNGHAGGAAFDVYTAESQFDADGNPVTSAKPSVLIESHYDPLDPAYLAATPANTPALAPDIILQGDISNLRGLVKIDSAAGSIRLEQKRDSNGQIIQPVEAASVRANDVEIETRNGDFIQSYTNTFVHAAGAPLTISPGDPNLTPDENPERFDTIERTPETAGSGIVANGSVLIAARYLNINGNIQSGIPEWGVRIPENAAVTIPGGGTGTFEQAQAHFNSLTPAQQSSLGAEYYTVSGATIDGLTEGDWTKMTVRYNARENRIELGGVNVQGGYIELFGQIFNTNNQGGGKLSVLDGYGKIKVDNQTDIPLWVNTLDTGRGVKGEINITDITGLNEDGTPVTTKTTYTRDPGGSRDGGFYNPTSGLRYAMNVGKKSGKIDNYRFSAGAIVGIEVFPTNLDNYWISGKTLENDPMARGEFLSILPGSGTGHYFQREQSSTTSADPVVGRTWFRCNWLTLCVYGTYYKEFSIQSATKTVTTDSVRADYPIGINFIGFDEGTVDVASTGDVVINGAINNRVGNTSISSAGSILQNGNLPITRSDNIVFSAGTGIGSASQSVLVNVNEGGRLDAFSNSGEIRIGQVLGDLNVGTVGGAGVSNVVLEAERNLLPFDTDSFVQGQRVELLARNGGIGTLNDTDTTPLVVRTGYTDNYSQWPNNGLKVTARDSINIRNEADENNADTYSGNLLLISAESQVGDVRIETTGNVIDNNPFETTDTRTEQELADLWDSLRLRGPLAEEKADEAVAAFRNGKSVNYALYWRMRSTQSDAGATYDPNYRLTAAEHDALAASGLDAAQIDQFESNRRTQYQQLHDEVGGFTNTFQEGYSYVVSAEEEAQIRKGSSWTDAQLELSVGAGLLKNITDTVATIKEPNAKGRNVTLVAGADIGSYRPVTIDLDAGLDAITIQQKAALAAAERGDATVSGNIITLIQPRSVNVTVGTGALTATATGDALIGSEQDLRIDRVTATGDIRIKTAGSLVNASSEADAINIIGNNVILEAANGGIGSLPDSDGNVDTPFRIDIDGALIARAANDIWVWAGNDLNVDTLYSRNDLLLDAQGSILDAHQDESAITPDINLRARNISLTSEQGTIGELTNPLDMGVNRDQAIHASTNAVGQGIYLNGPIGEYFNIGSIHSGDAVSLSSATGMKIDGAVTGTGPFTLVAGGSMLLTPNADVHATALGVFLRAYGLEMQDAQYMQDTGETLDSEYSAGDAAQMRVDAGTIDIETVGDAKITGIETNNPTASAIRVVSTEGRILDNGDTRLDIIADTPPEARLTIQGALGIGDDPLDVRLLNLDATSGGVIDITAQSNLNILALSAADRILLTATGDITGNTVESSGTGPNPDQDISITSSSGNVTLDSVSGTHDVRITAPMSLSVGDLNVGGSMFLAGDRIRADVYGTGSGDHGGAVTGLDGAPAAELILTLSSPANWRFSNMAADTGDIFVQEGNFWVDRMVVGQRLTLQNPWIHLLIDQMSRRRQPSDIQLYTGGPEFNLGLMTNHVFTDALVIGRKSFVEVISPDGNNTSLIEQSDAAIRNLRNDENPALNFKPVVGNDKNLVQYESPAVSLNRANDTLCSEGDLNCKTK